MCIHWESLPSRTCLPRPAGADLSALAALALAAAAAILILAPNFALAAPPVFLMYLYFYQLYLLVNF